MLDDDGRKVEPGSGVLGRIAVTGHIPLGYYKDPEKTEATFVEVDGVRYSMAGDYATVEADGSLKLYGRGSVCINSGGEKIGPAARRCAADARDGLHGQARRLVP